MYIQPVLRIAVFHTLLIVIELFSHKINKGLFCTINQFVSILGCDVPWKNNGVLPEGEIPFTVSFPADAYGRFVIDFMIVNGDGTRSTVTSPVIIPQEYDDKSFTTMIAGAGEKVTVKAVITNMTNGLSATLGEYSLNFASQSISVLSQDINGAFTKIDGFYVEPTEPTTLPPTEAPTPPPTEAPTAPPTEAPTPAPTVPPTVATSAEDI